MLYVRMGSEPEKGGLKKNRTRIYEYSFFRSQIEDLRENCHNKIVTVKYNCTCGFNFTTLCVEA